MSNYNELLLKNYDEAIEFLLQKYGPSQFDYYSEKSYQRFLNGEIKSVTRGKYSRTSEGLYCHHIDEDKELNLADKDFIMEQQLPFEFQKKERLVYCDLIEHAILHVLITKETSQNFGYPGYLVYIKPMIIDWYIEERIPRPKWMRNCYEKSFLTPEKAINIVRKMENIIGNDYYNNPDEYHEAKKKNLEKLEEQRRIREEQEKLREVQLREEWKKAAALARPQKLKDYYAVYPKFEEIGIAFDTPRLKIIAALYEYKYSATYKNKKELDSAMKPVLIDQLKEELYDFISNGENN